MVECGLASHVCAGSEDLDFVVICTSWHSPGCLSWLLVKSIWLFENRGTPGIDSLILLLQLFYILCVRHVLVGEYPRAVTIWPRGAPERPTEARLGPPPLGLWRCSQAGPISHPAGTGALHLGSHPPVDPGGCSAVLGPDCPFALSISPRSLILDGHHVVHPLEAESRGLADHPWVG